MLVNTQLLMISDPIEIKPRLTLMESIILDRNKCTHTHAINRLPPPTLTSQDHKPPSIYSGDF
jgi:hypothetical protein